MKILDDRFYDKSYKEYIEGFGKFLKLLFAIIILLIIILLIIIL